MSMLALQSLALGVAFVTHTTFASAATHTAASCAQPDVEAAVATASPGDTVLIPAGTAAWSNSISFRKGIHLKSRMWGDGDEIQMIVMSLRRNCLHAEHAYPVPRQVGQGHDGTGYVLDPLYIWNNPGNPRVGVNDYEPDEVGRNLRTADYLKPGRDYHVGVAKPGYRKDIYPHPLRRTNGQGPP
jgi:hypothetical protein